MIAEPGASDPSAMLERIARYACSASDPARATGRSVLFSITRLSSVVRPDPMTCRRARTGLALADSEQMLWVGKESRKDNAEVFPSVISSL
ncbi:hypothetical protein GCM10025738_02190 [Microbacterium fluvii]